MTVMGTNFLDEIAAREIIDPGEVLTALDEKVMRAIASKDSQAADGMDVVVISIDTSTHTVKFAGAKNPLLRVKDGQPTLLKGNLYAIGGKLRKGNKNYQSTEFVAEPGERLYLYSDGYQDQFGGPEGRKFMSRRFREMLVANSHLPWTEQEALLNQTLNDWQGTTSQTDDILVIGLEV